MPRIKKEEKDLELDIKSNIKKETFATRWFKDHAVNNANELKIICDLTARSAGEQFKLYLKNRNNSEVFGVVFYGTFITILEFLRSKQKKWNNFTIEIANSINIGYTNNEDEENEKVGNFMPVLEYIGVNRKCVPGTDINDNIIYQSAVDWKTLNIKKNSSECNEIQSAAYNKLNNEYRVLLRESEAVIPLFCIFMDNISSVLKMKFREAEGTDVSEVSMNVFGLFDIFYSYDEEENREIIEFQPNIMMKLALKNDANASVE